MNGLAEELRQIVGEGHMSTDPDVLASHSVDWTGRRQGRARALVRPGCTREVAEVLRACRARGTPVTVQGGRSSLVAGTVPEHDDVLLSTGRLDRIGALDTRRGRIRVGAGVVLEALQQHLAGAGRSFGVDLGSRGVATLGGMAATDAGGLRTVRHGPMSSQVTGIEVVLPDGSTVRRMTEVPSDSTGYDLVSLWTGSEGTLGVVTELELVTRRIPARSITVVLGFAGLDEVMATREILMEVEGLAALELLDGRGVKLAVEELRLAPPTPRGHPWYLLLQVTGEHDRTEELAGVIERCPVAGEPAVGIDRAGEERLWQARESFAEVVSLSGPPVKVDLSLPPERTARFAADATRLVKDLVPGATCVLFGHVGEGNLHLNVLGCPEESLVYPPLMRLIDEAGGNVSSEHGIGSLKRDYIGMTRSEADIAAMRTVKDAFDPDRLLNPAVLFRRVPGPAAG